MYVVSTCGTREKGTGRAHSPSTQYIELLLVRLQYILLYLLYIYYQYTQYIDGQCETMMLATSGAPSHPTTFHKER
jgi:hypothetical protein